MSDAWNEALKEAYASAPDGVVIIHTLQLAHPALPESIWLVQDYGGHTCTLETGQPQYFQPAPFRFTLPATGSDGLQELDIAIDNVDQAVTDFLAAIGSNPEPVTVRYRAYLSTDKSQPQNGVPLTLFLADIKVNAVEVVGRASFADIINRPFLSFLYTVNKFPGLA